MCGKPAGNRCGPQTKAIFSLNLSRSFIMPCRSTQTSSPGRSCRPAGSAPGRRAAGLRQVGIHRHFCSVLRPVHAHARRQPLAADRLCSALSRCGEPRTSENDQRRLAHIFNTLEGGMLFLEELTQCARRNRRPSCGSSRKAVSATRIYRHGSGRLPPATPGMRRQWQRTRTAPGQPYLPPDLGDGL